MSRTVSSTIVIGFDGSPESNAAAEWAAQEAVRRHADLDVLTALRPYPAGLPGVPYSGEYTDDGTAAGLTMIDEVTRRLRRRFPELAITGHFHPRDPRPALLEAGRSALMTVVGNRGSGRLPEALTGSVALHLAAHGRSPVAVVPRIAAPATGPVLVGVDPLGTSQPPSNWPSTRRTGGGRNSSRCWPAIGCSPTRASPGGPSEHCRWNWRRTRRCCPSNSPDGRTNIPRWPFDND